MNVPSQIFFNGINHGYKAAIIKKNSLWLLPFYMVVAAYFYYEKLCRTMRTAIVSDFLKIFCVLDKEKLASYIRCIDLSLKFDFYSVTFFILYQKQNMGYYVIPLCVFLFHLYLISLLQLNASS